MAFPKNIPPDSLIRGDDGRQFWQGKNGNEDEMIGTAEAQPGMSEVDLQGSREFLAKLGIGTGQGLRTLTNALEGGAGIGRVTQGVLLELAEQVDVIEPVVKFTEELYGRSGIRDIFNFGLEEWDPAKDVEYDLIWNQWCLCHLTDEQLVRYLKRCNTVLRPGTGLLIIKENLSIRGVDVFNSTDSTVIREDRKFSSIFRQAGLQLVKSQLQRGFPRNLLPVKMYALRSSEV
ncbi:Alpha N-terminal protein methyltransferase [Trichophyton interdigitale]|uniref:Alpha N-terminal protein methyltransferase 1 n=1 Tax=Trichophyton interdigitale TaxID=101480 RepID=A0A9P4YJQ7_9EURO|nr:Alpha N-terminal protein methyltransferase [Trichophyton interdigitale]KAF3899165.1 Alpha N-terminal protein methyltransferase [Trichophyton interdigitale]KAG8208934.1 Alpha N-terminal protein methyltransferase [Trichophyton interdigitale]